MKISRSLVWLNVITLVLFVFILLEVFLDGFLVRWDEIIHTSLKSSNAFMIELSKLFAFVFDVKCLLVICILIAIYLWFRDSKKDSVFFVVVGLVGTGIIYILKEFVSRARPEGIVSETGFSFVSGHATIAVVFFGLLTYLIFKRSRNYNLKIASVIVSSVMILLIGFTRLYLGVHWFSDVLGGFIVGVFILTSCVIVKERFW